MTTAANTFDACEENTFTSIDNLLRDRGSVLKRIQSGAGLSDFARTMLLTIVVSGVAFGAAIGFYRGGIQIVYAAIKIPLLLLLTAAVCTPVLTALNAALDRPSDLRRDLALVLGSLALGSLVLFAQAPLVLLAICFEASYHQIILIIVGCSALAGGTSLVLLFRGVGSVTTKRARTAATALLAVVAIVGAQMAWTLRPYAVRPRSTSVPFVRNVEGSLLESILHSADSARGIYTRDSAPLPDGPSYVGAGQ